MELQVGVKVLLKNSEGKHLLLKRSDKKYPEVGAKWDIVGGRIIPGTSLLENLKREVREETGLELSDEPKLIAAQDILRLTYTASIAGEPKLNSDHTEFGWFTMEEMKHLENLDNYFSELLD